MKHLWISLAILAAMFCALQFNFQYLVRFVEPLNTSLSQADASAKAGDWKTASAQTQQVRQTWDNKAVYLHVFLRHSDIDQINLLFGEVTEYAASQEYPEYSAATARLRLHLGLLHEMEQFSWKNIL